MKVPYKIYLRQIPDQKVECFWYRKRGKFCDNHEYIRKDALLEWANLEIKKLDDFLKRKYSPMELGQRVILVRLIDKLNNF